MVWIQALQAKRRPEPAEQDLIIVPLRPTNTACISSGDHRKSPNLLK
jgi:hypothetical protein